MAIEQKRTQQRYGSYDALQADKDNLLPNEFASVTSGDPNTSDGNALYFNFGVSNTKRMMTAEDAEKEIENASQNVIQKATEQADRAQAIADGVQQSGEEQVQKIEEKGKEVVESIPQDYTDLTEEVSQLSKEIDSYGFRVVDGILNMTYKGVE